MVYLVLTKLFNDWANDHGRRVSPGSRQPVPTEGGGGVGGGREVGGSGFLVELRNTNKIVFVSKIVMGISLVQFKILNVHFMFFLRYGMDPFSWIGQYKNIHPMF